jgi:hypothetical protein
MLSDAEHAEFGLSRTDKFGQPGPHRGNRTVDLIINARDTRMLRSRPKCPSSRQVARIEPSWRQINRRAFRVPRKCGAILLEPISKLPTALDRITMSNDSAQGRAVGAHPGSFSRGEYCRWASWAQTILGQVLIRWGCTTTWRPPQLDRAPLRL